MITSAKLRLVLTCLVAMAVVSGCTADLEPEAAGPRVVRVAKVQAAVPDARTVTGIVRATTRAALAFEVGGRIESLNAQVGEEVDIGETLATLDPGAFELVLQQARADLARTEAVEAEVASRLDRQRQLAERGLVPTASLEAVVAEMNAAVQATVSARAQAEIAERDLKLTQLVAPFDGRIAERLVEPFTTVAAGEPVFEVDGSRLEVVAPIPLIWTGSLVEGAMVTISTRDGPVEGRLGELGTRSAEAGAVSAVITLPSDVDLISGAAVEVLLPQEASAGFEVPFGAVLPGSSPGEGHVLIIEDGRAQPRAVSFSHLGADSARVESGLAEGELVITAGARFVTAGQLVSVAQERSL